MEIISYSDNRRITQKRATNRNEKSYIPFFKHPHSSSLDHHSVSFSAGSILSISTGSVSPDKNGQRRFSIVAKRFFRQCRIFTASFFQHVKIVYGVCLCVVIFFSVKSFFDYRNTHFHTVKLGTAAVDELSELDDAMSHFALDIEKDDFDENGNVLSGDGTAAQISAASFSQPVTFQTYTVKTGDSVSSILRKFGLSNVSTLIAINNIQNVRSLPAGKKLRIPSEDGLLHEVSSGETVTGISAEYGVSVEDLLDVNDLSSQVLKIGTSLFIPGARLDTESLHRALGDLFIYPLKTVWRLTSPFGKRSDPFTGVLSFHTGIDMAVPIGSPVVAVMSGKIVYTGFSNVFGNYIIIKHTDGFQTLYGHLSKILVRVGQSVSQGSQIALSGSTGYSTGPHLHFTVYKNGKLIDPLTVLK